MKDTKYPMKKQWLLPLISLLAVLGCVSAPPATLPEANFFPEQASLYLQIDMGVFRKLSTDLSKNLPKEEQKSWNTLIKNTNSLAYYQKDRVAMLRAQGRYPKGILLDQLKKNPQEFSPINADTFRLEQPPALLQRLALVPADLHIPASGTLYLSSALQRELQRRNPSNPFASAPVEEAFGMSKRAVVYIPYLSQFLATTMGSNPFPVPINGVLVSIVPRKPQYQVEALMFLPDGFLERRVMIAQARFIVSGFANNPRVNNLVLAETEQGLQFSFSLEHKELVSLVQSASAYLG
jgi:hypothetical protein